MYMNIKPNKHKRISFKIMTMTSLGFTVPPPSNFRSTLKFSPLPLLPPKFNFFAQVPPSPSYFGLKFLDSP